jgi:hypothetical protein
VTSCTLYRLTVRAGGLGPGTITLNNASITAIDGTEILASATGAQYQVSVPGGPNPPLAKTALIYTYPNNATLQVGQTYMVGVYVTGGGQNFWMARGTIGVSPNLQIEGAPLILGGPGSGCQQYTTPYSDSPVNICPGQAGTRIGGGSGCLDFDFAANRGVFERLDRTSPASIDFQVTANTPDSGAANLIGRDCSIVFLTLRVVAPGTGRVSITNADVVRVADQGSGGGSIFRSTVDANFSLVP